MLRVVLDGTTDSDQTYALDAGGWSRVGSSGFRYRGPTGADGDPVKLLVLKRTRSGRATLKALVNGNLGTQSLDVVPPNSGDEAGLVLDIGNGGGRYCVALGGAAGGTEIEDTDARWRVLRATAEPGCPAP